MQSNCLLLALAIRPAAPPRRAVAATAAAVAAPPAEADAPPRVLSAKTYADAGISITVTHAGGAFTVDVAALAPRPDLILHWGVNDWELPAEAARPPGTLPAGDKAVRTPFGAANAVRLSFPEDACPAAVVFVLNEGEQWFNSGGGDFAAYLKPPTVEELSAKILAAESTFERWSLYSRQVMATQVLDAAVAAGPPGMALVFTWLRLSSMRQLDWYRGTNYQSKDAAHAGKALAQRMADTARAADAPLCRLFARAALAGLPRGGGNGDDIRHGILNVMRENGIAEGHRPGIHDDFLETWHQKLHTNTTPEDVTICEAYLAFLHSGSMEDFWRVAWDNGRVTRESLAAMDHPVTPTPCHLPHLIGPMQHYLWILKTTHSGADLDTAFAMARGKLDGDLAWTIGDILAHREDWWVPGKIVEARRALAAYWRGGDSPRDVLLLDIALDSYFRLCVDRADKGAMSPDELLGMVQMVLDNAGVAAESEELAACGALWRRVGETPGRWSDRGWGQLALAAADNVALCLEGYADGIAALVAPHAAAFGAACASDPAFTVNFAEEVVRSQPVFILSPLLRHLGPALRAAAGVGAWQVVSQAAAGRPAAGVVAVMPDLSSIQGTTLEAATVIVADRLTGNEDIPEGVVAILTGAATDVLSHVAIRARAQGVLLATCFDPAQLEAARALAGGWAEVGQTPAGDVLALPAAAPPSGAAAGGVGGGGAAGVGGAPKLKLARPAAAGGEGPWVLSEAEFREGAVGGKGLNLAALRGKLPAW
jgi:alpha-glucan,water dikinase